MKKGDLVECLEDCVALKVADCYCMVKGNIGICEEVRDKAAIVQWIHGVRFSENDKYITKSNLRVITHGRF